MGMMGWMMGLFGMWMMMLLGGSMFSEGSWFMH